MGITSKKFRDTRTGEIVTQIPIMDIKYFVEVMDDYTAVALAEGFQEAESEEQVIEAWQHLHDTGLAYTLQGSFGRQAVAMIEQGVVTA